MYRIFFNRCPIITRLNILDIGESGASLSIAVRPARIALHPKPRCEMGRSRPSALRSKQTLAMGRDWQFFELVGSYATRGVAQHFSNSCF